MKIQYSPTFFLPSKKQTVFKTLEGECLEPMKFEDVRNARDFMKRYEEVSNFKIYGQERYEYAFIADEHKGTLLTFVLPLLILRLVQRMVFLTHIVPNNQSPLFVYTFTTAKLLYLVVVSIKLKAMKSIFNVKMNTTYANVF
jgi:hypothetical protein